MRAPAGPARTAGRRANPRDEGDVSEVSPGSLATTPRPPHGSSRPHRGHNAGAWWSQFRALAPQVNFSPPGPNPPASWRSWPPLPGRAGLQCQALPAHRSSLHCCGQTGWKVPQRSIPAEGSRMDGSLGAGDASGAPRRPRPGEEEGRPQTEGSGRYCLCTLMHTGYVNILFCLVL